MPSDEIPELEQDQVMTIVELSLNSRAFKGRPTPDTTNLITEVNQDFAKTMNKIIFNKHMKGKGKELIAGNLTLPPPPKTKAVPFFGMISIPQHNFPEEFSAFCFNTLYIKDESILAMEQIRGECLDVLEKEIFNTNFNKTLRLDEFKQIQDSSVSQCAYSLRETWVSNIKNIIKKCFSSMTKGWFNLNETSKEAYQVGKLKKFLITVKLIMEETLLFLSEKSLNKYVDTILAFLPTESKVVSPIEVTNTFPSSQTELQDSPNDDTNKVLPLFSVDLLLGPSDDLPHYTFDPLQALRAIVDMFDRGINDFLQIPQVEPKLFPHFFKTQTKVFLKSALRPMQHPGIPDPNDKRALPDPNTWVWLLYDALHKAVQKAIRPMYEYLEVYRQFKEVNELNVEEYMTAFDDEENPPPVTDIKREIYQYRKMQQQILDQIPQKIVISFFVVDCREVRDQFANKYALIAQKQIDLISKRCSASNDEILTKFEEMKTKIKRIPKDIEELTDTKEYMASVGMELEKLKNDIAKLMESYDILDEFAFKLSQDSYDRKWNCFGAPKNIVELITKQTAFLDKEKEKFMTQMVNNQDEFSERLNELEQIIGNFSQHQNIEDYEEVGATVMQINERLKKCHEESKRFNTRELMIGKESQTDYSQVSQMEKDFKPYSNLWLTTHTWFKSHHSWLNEKWEDLDAGNLQDTVEKSVKTMTQVLRSFKDKDLPGILKIADQVKLQIDDFKPYVPLAVALRTDGMKDRHWDTISEKVDFEVRPDENFTLTTVMNMGLLDNLSIVEESADR